MRKKNARAAFIKNIISVTKVNWVFYYPKCYISINCKLACEIFETCEFFVTLSAGDLRSAANYYIKASRELAIPHLGEFKEV